MPKAQKSSQNGPGAKIKQITDFFPRKSTFSQDISLNVLSPTAGGQKDAKQSLVKENTKPHSRNLRSKVHSANENPLNSTATSGAQRPHSPLSTKPTHITSPIQPPAKRLRSQSVVSNKQTKRAKHILCESKFEEEKMEVEDDSVVYVPPDTTVRNPPLLQVPFLDSKQTENPHVIASPSHQLEVNSMVPSSLSEEKELELSLPDKKDIEAVKEAVDRWRYQASSPSSLANENRQAGVATGLHHPPTAFEANWNTAGGSINNPMPSQPNVKITIPIPPTDEPDSTHSLSPLKILDKDSKTNQIIEGIRARAYAQSRAKQPSSPDSTIASLDSSDDEDELNVFDFGLKDKCKLESMLKVKSPIKPTRYNLRKPVAKTVSEKPKPILDLGRDSSPSPPAKRKPGINPLDALLKEKRVVNGKNVTRSADREAQLRDLANMNLNDDSDNGDVGLKGSGDSPPLITESDGNPFIDDDQKQQVMEILEGDRAIKDEEEHLRQQGKVGVPLWGISESCSMDSCDGLPRLEYQGSDPTLQSFTQIVNHGDCDFVDLVIQSGALELANYTEGGFNVVNYLIGLALSQRVDGLDISASRMLSTLLGNPTIGTPVPLLGHILLTLRALGAQLSLLERLGWTIDNNPRNTISATERPIVVERLVSCVTDFAKSGYLHQREVPDVIVVLLLLGIEPSSSHEMRLQVTQAMNEICHSVGEENVVEVEVETATCNKVLHLVQPHSLQNKLYVLDFLASGGGRIARIARSVAHAMLTGKPTLLPLHYSELPPLPELVTVIEVASRDTSRPEGKFEIHEATDYVDLACWTRILAIAITDIPRYVKQEELGRGMSSPMKSPSKEKDQSLILMLHDKLYKIHGRIQDTRAAHLDRSRTKAVIFQTAFRILYQYQAATQYQRKNNHDIQSYFRKK